MKTFVLPLLAALAATAVPASAEEVSRPVGYADLDLATRDGRAELDARVTSAVHRMCGDPDLRDLPAVRESNRCRRVATQSGDRAAAVAASNYRQRLAARSIAGR